jgi:3-methyl-2-oxobutanoate hydroxymethyltransferase
LNAGAVPKFAKNFAHLEEPIVQAVKDYAGQVRQGTYPGDEHCYHVKPGQLEKLGQIMNLSN